MEQYIYYFSAILTLMFIAGYQLTIIYDYRRSTKELSKQIDDLSEQVDGLRIKNTSLENIKNSLKDLSIKLEKSQNMYCDKWLKAKTELEKYKGKRGPDGKFIKKNP